MFRLLELLRKIRLSIEGVYCAGERQRIQCRVGQGERGRCQENVSPQGQACWLVAKLAVVTLVRQGFR